MEHDNNGLVFSTEVELEQQLEVISRHCTGNIIYVACVAYQYAARIRLSLTGLLKFHVVTLKDLEYFT